VWIDLFAGHETPQTRALHTLTARGERLMVGDLVLVEVLQGTRNATDFARKLARLSFFDPVQISTPDTAIVAARNYQHLRSLGITIRKTIDTLIATRCILDAIPLLYSDRDYDPFVQHLGLRSAMDLDPGVN
jgi:predicted nucleic acid-binding protein